MTRKRLHLKDVGHTRVLVLIFQNNPSLHANRFARIYLQNLTFNRMPTRSFFVPTRLFSEPITDVEANQVFKFLIPDCTEPLTLDERKRIIATVCASWRYIHEEMLIGRGAPLFQQNSAAISKEGRVRLVSPILAELRKDEAFMQKVELSGLISRFDLFLDAVREMILQRR
ncbi:hypothetical protein EJ08DRAFT_377370 [Tothia fuscella]|uniref:Uncharacterized protein n=1 Tax=Tothia fuscella TaxID=1048955 RepID=A0A9P4NLI9_9PEZI|nr:hypothetical protein EJ08DRAFT_377370 [Tothia fuscella]